MKIVHEFTTKRGVMVATLYHCNKLSCYILDKDFDDDDREVLGFPYDNHCFFPHKQSKEFIFKTALKTGDEYRNSVNEKD